MKRALATDSKLYSVWKIHSFNPEYLLDDKNDGEQGTSTFIPSNRMKKDLSRTMPNGYILDPNPNLEVNEIVDGIYIRSVLSTKCSSIVGTGFKMCPARPRLGFFRFSVFELELKQFIFFRFSNSNIELEHLFFKFELKQKPRAFLTRTRTPL